MCGATRGEVLGMYDCCCWGLLWNHSGACWSCLLLFRDVLMLIPQCAMSKVSFVGQEKGTCRAGLFQVCAEPYFARRHLSSPERVHAALKFNIRDPPIDSRPLQIRP